MRVAARSNTVLTIEAHVHSYLESPFVVLQLLEHVEGLKLTLDYAYFACLGYRQEEIDPLAPHAAHVHLRQARPGVLQAKANEGTINMNTLFGTLRDSGYQGAMSLEYVHQDYMDTRYDDALTETISLELRAAAAHNCNILGYGLTLFGYFETDDLEETKWRLSKSAINAKWSKFMESIMKIEVDPTKDFPYLLPLQFHME